MELQDGRDRRRRQEIPQTKEERDVVGVVVQDTLNHPAEHHINKLFGSTYYRRMLVNIIRVAFHYIDG